MRQLSPERQHPVIWALVDLLGLTRGEIARRCGVSEQTTHHMLAGHAVRPETLERLRSLLDRMLDGGFLAHQPPVVQVVKTARGEIKYRTPEAILAYRRAAFAAARWVAQAYRKAPRPRRTELASLLLAQLGTAGERRSLVLGNLRAAGHTSYAVQACARRLGVRTRTDSAGRLVWIPPVDMATVVPLRPPPIAVPPRSESGSRLRQAMVDLLVENHGKSSRPPQPAGEIVAALVSQGFSQAAVYRCARDLALERETTGFGPNRRTTWRLRLR